MPKLNYAGEHAPLGAGTEERTPLGGYAPSRSMTLGGRHRGEDPPWGVCTQPEHDPWGQAPFSI